MSVWFFVVILLVGSFSRGIAQDTSAAAVEEKTEEAETPEGHSTHGEAFNEGPRQAAYLMDGVGDIRFEVTTKSPEAKAFVVQGIGQLHGYWYFESERSFRQAAMLDPDCAIAYWGMAMSNRSNAVRSKAFIKEAMDRKDKASRRELLWIQSSNTYINAKEGNAEEKKKRAKKYISDLEELLFEFPDEIEAKAFLCEFLYSAKRDGIDMVSYLAVDSLIQQVLDAAPLHPVHHYRIHLWDNKKSEKALESAARCGLAAPSIAHMWHMPGHIYSRLKRYHDAVYQQEASARVDHAHMMKDLVLPDQIHNFAHNNEWCIRNLINIGRANAAIDLATNMIQMPRHPKYNHIGKFGSYKYGRQRLLDVLRAFELHDKLIALAATPYLETCDNADEDLKRDRYLACALVETDQAERAGEIRAQLDKAVTEENDKQKKAGDDAEAKAKEEKKDEKEVKKARDAAEGKLRGRIQDLEKAIHEIDGRLAAKKGEIDSALELFKKAGGVPVEEQVALLVKSGKMDEAVKRATEHVSTNKNEVRPLACQVETLWHAGKQEEAKKALSELQKISSTIDRDIPIFARLDAITREAGIEGDWRKQHDLANDIGARPPLDSLGPFRWQPGSSVDWELPDTKNELRRLSDFRGTPVVVIFYLGHGCLHCAEQLQKFAPKAKEFKDAGYELIAVSTDDQKALHLAHGDLDEGFPFPLVANAELNVFKTYRCYDDFEQQALHGTFLIDGDGLIRWQDISFEPFMDPDFLLKEAKRLMDQDDWKPTPDELKLNVTATSDKQ